jgi:hypothetical protein
MEKIYKIIVTEKCFNLSQTPMWWNNHLGEEFKATKKNLEDGLSIYHIVKEDLLRIGNGSISAVIHSPYCIEKIEENEIIYWK